MSNAQIQAIDARAKRILRRANALGLSKRGSPLVIDQARELIAAEEGARNWHVLKAEVEAGRRPSAEGHAPAMLAALGIVSSALDRMADGDDFNSVIEETGATAAVVTARHEAVQAGIKPGPAYGDMLRTLTSIAAQNDIWTEHPAINSFVNGLLKSARDTLKMHIDGAGDLAPNSEAGTGILVDSELFRVIHERDDGQVFAVEQHGVEFQAVYPSDLAELGACWETATGAEEALREDLSARGIVPNEGLIDCEDGLSRRHRHEASQQGWNVFDADGRELQIQREDDAAIFPGDDEAWTFVIRHAIDNPTSAAARALELIKASSPAEYEAISAFATKSALQLPSVPPRSTSNGEAAYLWAEGWSHCFVGDMASIVRWVFRRNGIDKVVFAEIQSGAKWVALDRAAMADIEESLFDNDVPDRYAEDFAGDVTASALPPAFAPKDL